MERHLEKIEVFFKHQDWRRQRSAAHERGVDIDAIPSDQEIILFFEPVPLRPLVDNTQSDSRLSGE